MDIKASPSPGWPTCWRCLRTDLRLFGKPESFVNDRMGVAVANGETTDVARRGGEHGQARQGLSQRSTEHFP